MKKLYFLLLLLLSGTAVEGQVYTAGGVSFEMVYVQGGSLYVGSSPSPLSQPTNVTLSDFSIGKTPVTQSLWKAVMGLVNTNKGSGDNYPAYSLSWNRIVGTEGAVGYTVNGIDYKTEGFCYKLSQLVGGNVKFCLPTEAQWEYAARGGQKTKGYLYSGSNNIDDVAWYSGNSGGTTHPVATKQANELGIYDMSGNVSEWCSDVYGSTYPSSPNDPTGSFGSTLYIMRGHDWDAPAYPVSSRVAATSTVALTTMGLRLAISYASTASVPAVADNVSFTQKGAEVIVSSSATVAAVCLYNAQGVLLHQEQPNATAVTLSLAGFPKGIYLFQVIDRAGQTAIHKVIY